MQSKIALATTLMVGLSIYTSATAVEAIEAPDVTARQTETSSPKPAAEATAKTLVKAHRFMTAHEGNKIVVGRNLIAEAAAKAAAEAAAKAEAERVAAEQAAAAQAAAEEAAAQKAAQEQAAQQRQQAAAQATGRTVGTFRATFYDPAVLGSSMGYGGIAANLNVLPRGTRVKIVLSNGMTMIRTVNDTGTFAASNPYQIDIAIPNSQIPAAGVLNATVTILN